MPREGVAAPFPLLRLMAQAERLTERRPRVPHLAEEKAGAQRGERARQSWDSGPGHPSLEREGVSRAHPTQPWQRERGKRSFTSLKPGDWGWGGKTRWAAGGGGVQMHRGAEASWGPGGLGAQATVLSPDTAPLRRCSLSLLGPFSATSTFLGERHPSAWGVLSRP